MAPAAGGFLGLCRLLSVIEFDGFLLSVIEFDGFDWSFLGFH